MAAPQNMTNQMKESLDNLRASLLCPLCNQLMDNCSMLHCGHSFCHGCIIEFTSDNWNCPVLGCGQPVSAGKSCGTSYVKKNAQIESVISALIAIEQNIANAPEKWWVANENGAVQFQEDVGEDDVIDFQASTVEQTNEPSGCKRNNAENDDQSSTTKDLDEVDRKTSSNDEGDLVNISDTSLFDTENHINRERISCSVPMLFSQQLSPISMKNSQQFEVQSQEMASSGRKTATFSHIETTKKDFDSGSKSQGSEYQQTATISEFQSASESPRYSAKRRKCPTEALDGRKTATFSQIESVNDNMHSLDSNRKMNDSENQQGASSVEIENALKSPCFIREKFASPKSDEFQADSTKGEAVTSTNITRRSSRVSFQPKPRVMLLCPSWTLKAKDSRCIRKCLLDGSVKMISKYPTGDDLDLSFDLETESGRKAFMKSLSCHREENVPPVPLSCYAVSTDKDYRMDEGIVVPRSFGYYLAVAIGMPIVDIGFLSTFSSKKKNSSGHQQYPFPYSPASGKKTSDSAYEKFHVIGASDYAWNSPQKAAAAALERHQCWLKHESADALDTLLPGTDLLSGYNIILLGEYDQLVNGKQRTAKRKKQEQDESEMKMTRGRLNMLLQFTGAKVYDVHNVTTMKQLKAGLNSYQCDFIDDLLPAQSESPTLKNLLRGINSSTKLIAIVRDSSSVKFAEELLSQYLTASALPSNVMDHISIVTSDWLLDSIGEFEVKKAT